MGTRRDFLRKTGLVAGGLAVTPLTTGCAGVPVVEPGDPATHGVRLGLYPSSSTQTGRLAVLDMLDRLDLRWLGAGDSVFVKVACNSGNVHPAVTSPEAVRGLVEGLLSRGAGRVLVGDQSGVASVRLAEGEQRFSSTETLMRRNGLLAAIEESGGEPHFFDDQGFEQGYVPADLPGDSAWSRVPHIPRVLTEVDHIVYLPRLASHCLTGYTHGHKIAVGFLRDDARFDLHHDAGKIYEKYTEVNYCEQIASRLRLVLTLAESVLVDNGPDNGTVCPADPRIVLASEHLANHDAIAVALLTWAQRNLVASHSTGGVAYGPWAPMSNAGLRTYVEARTRIPWTADGVGLPSTYFAHDYAAGAQADHALRHAYELLGGVPRQIDVEVNGEAPDSLLAHLSAHEQARV